MDIALLLILINVVIFILPNIISFDGPRDSVFNFMYMFWQDNSKVLSGEWYRLFTSLFVHGGAAHLFMNMFSLWNLRSEIMLFNRLLGGLNPGFRSSNLLFQNNNLLFILVYLLSGLGGNIASMLFTKAPSVGASGAICGVIGYIMGYGLMYNNFGVIQSILINIAILVLISFTIPNIDNWAHAGGFLTGVLLYFVAFYLIRL
ncbi:MAG: rhomboid family intramembrane serine protease [Patescibacteria group bacterium]